MTTVRELVAAARKWAHRLRASGDYGPHVAELLDGLADALEEQERKAPDSVVDKVLPDGATIHQEQDNFYAQAELPAPSVDAVLREVERRLREGREPEEVDGLITQVFYVGEVARMLVAAARCVSCDGCGYHRDPWPINPAEARRECTYCHGTGVDPTRLDAALKAGEG